MTDVIDMPDSPTIVITGEYAKIGVPVRLEWLETEATPDWLAHDHPGLTRRDTTGYHHEPQVRYTSIVVPLDSRRASLAGWSEPGAPDRHAFDHTKLTVRSATPEEAAPVLAAEARLTTIRDLLTRFRDLTRERDDAQDWAPDPDLSHIDISDFDITVYRIEYREYKARSIRIHRHLRTLDGYQAVAPGEDDYDCSILYPDPDRRVVWLYRGHNMIVRPYRLDDKMAGVVDQLTTLLKPHTRYP